MVEPLIQKIKSFYPRSKTDEQIHQLIHEIYDTCGNFISLPKREKVRFVLSRRMSRKSGIFKFRISQKGEHDLCIVLSRKLLIDIDGNAEALYSCLGHEVCHASNFLKFCYGYCALSTHDGTFIQDMLILNNIFVGIKPITVLHDLKVTFNWRLRCTSCGKVLRKLVNRGNLRKSACHSVCGGLLEYEPIKVIIL